jgi:hypothetical protein
VSAGTPVIWLTFWDGLRFWRDENGGQPLRWRYRKTEILVALAASQRGKPWSRSRLAELLWSDAMPTKAKANLRVLLSDLQAVWREAALPPLWDINREEVCLRTDSALWCDLEWMQRRVAGHPVPWPDNDALACLLNSSAQDWLLDLQDDRGPDLVDWVAARREHCERLQLALRRDANEAEQPAAAEPSPPSVSVAPLSEPQMRQFVLWRIESAQVWDADDFGGHAPVALSGGTSWPMVSARIAAMATSLGATVVESDDWSLTLALGLTQTHSGQRWRALQMIQPGWALVQEAGLSVRMGAVTGWALVEPTAGGVRVRGWRMRLLAALALWAEPGHLACNEGWAELLEPCTPQRHTGLHFRGLEQPADAWLIHLDALSELLLPVGTGLLSTRFAGRQSAIERLRSAWHGVSQHRQPHIVRILAPSGWGKTRLAAEFVRWVSEHSGQVWWVGAQSELRPVMWRALRQTLQRHVPGGMDAHVLGHWLHGLGLPHDEQSTAVLHHFLQATGVAQSDVDVLATLLASWWDLREPGYTAAATVVVIDDAQWLDEASAGLLQRVAQRGTGVLWVLTQRHPLSPGESATSVLVGQDTLSPIELPPLTDEEAMTLLDSLPAAASLTRAQRSSRVAMARGVPLFLLADLSPQNSTASSAFAEYCEALLNRLEAHRPELRLAAVLGVRFSVQDLLTLAGEERAAPALRQALNSGLCVPRDEGHLAFFHPALREYLLSTCTKTLLQDSSVRCAALLASQGEHARSAVLWQQAERVEPARQAWMSAAAQASGHDDLESMLQAYQALRELGYPGGEQGLHARAGHTRALLARYGYAHALAHQIAAELAQCVEQSPRDLDADLMFEALAFHYLKESGQGHVEALRAGERMVQGAQTPSAVFTASWAMANAYFWRGDFALAAPWFEDMRDQGHALDRKQRMRYFPSDPLVFGQLQSAWMTWLSGDRPAFLQAWSEVGYLAQQSQANQQDRTVYHAISILLAEFEGQGQTALDHAAQAVALASAEGFEFWLAFAELYSSIWQSSEGTPVDLMALAKKSQSVLENYDSATPIALWLTARCLAAVGAPDLALATIEGTLQRMQADGGSVCLLDAMWFHAQMLDELGRTDDAAHARERAHAEALQRGWLGWLAHHPLA